MVGLRIRVWALVVATVLVVPSGALAKAAYVCSMSGQRSFSCCCAAAKAKAKKSAKQLAGQARLQVDDCCEAFDGQDTTGTVPPPSAEPFAAALFERLSVAEMISAWRTTEPSRFGWSRGPPATGPPLFIKHCSLLN